MGASTCSASAMARLRPSAVDRSWRARRRSMPYFSSGWAPSKHERSSSAPRCRTKSAGSKSSGSVTANSSIFERPASGVMLSSMN